MAAAKLTLTVGVSPACAEAVSALADAAKRFPEIRDLLVDIFHGSVELVRIDRDGLFATRAIDGGILLEPSDRLLELVLAAGTGQRDVLISKIHGWPRV